jgi:hypothetical protein
MADKDKLANMLSGEQPIRKGRGYQLSTTQPDATQPAAQDEAHITEASRNLEPKNSRKEEGIKRRKLGYEIREDLIRQCKQVALDGDRKIYEVIEEALVEYLAKRSA